MGLKIMIRNKGEVKKNNGGKKNKIERCFLM